MHYDPANPLIVQADRTVLVEVDNPRYAEAHYHWGYALQRLERHADAIERYEMALALRPDYPEAHNNIGNALLSLGRAEEAIGRYERAIAVGPGYAEAHINLASTLMLLNRAPEAVVPGGKSV